MPSQYPQNVVTKKGLAMIAESVATKKNLIFTRVVVGDGDATGRNFNDMSAVISPKMELPVTSGVNEGNGQYLVTATLSNNRLDVGFFPREVGLYAKVDGKTEQLYSYTNGGNNVGYVPDKTSPIDSEIYKIRTVIGNAKNITINLNNSTFLTRGELDNHNNDNNAHAELLKLFLKLTGGEVTGDITINNHLLKLKNVNNKEILIRFNNDNTLDIGNAYNGEGINGISLCSIKRPGWYNGSGSTKGFALSEELEPIKTLLGQGAIVSSKLDERNGFIKFANGFTIQWGSSGDDNSAKSAVTYPIAFKRVFISCAIDAFWGGASVPKYLANSAYESTNTRAVFVGNDQYVGSYYWFAFGIA